jgi:hypothetical protein
MLMSSLFWRMLSRRSFPGVICLTKLQRTSYLPPKVHPVPVVLRIPRMPCPYASVPILCVRRLSKVQRVKTNLVCARRIILVHFDVEAQRKSDPICCVLHDQASEAAVFTGPRRKNGVISRKLDARREACAIDESDPSFDLDLGARVVTGREEEHLDMGVIDWGGGGNYRVGGGDF